MLLVLNFSRKAKLSSIIQYKKIVVVLLLLFIISPCVLQMLPDNKLTISFIDVGQGDSMLIQTPACKTILIDGGGSETGKIGRASCRERV